jgi:ribosomal protein S18 acetylase RimI-like enzyme
MGVGKSLTNACIKLALDNKPKKIFLHSTKLVKVTWAMYEKMGFERSTYLDFNLHRLSIYGFRLAIEDNA